MKKYFLSIVALAGMLFATSCQESLVEPQVDGTTTFTIEIPGQMGTKAVGDSYELFVEVYSADGNTKIHRLEDAITVGTPKNVSLNLVATQVYDIIFWAQKDGATYNVENLNKVEITNRHHNSEDGAAFYAIKNDYKPVEVNNPSVTLKRPFAQLNIGTIDEVSYGDNNGNKKLEILSTNIKVESAANYFERINTQEFPELGEGRTDVVFEYTGGEVLTSTMTIGEGANAKTYKQVSMDYISVLGNKGVVTVTATIEVEDPNGEVSTIERVITNVPLQMNYRTNIVGNLITSTSDFTVTIDESWGGTDINKEVEFREVATAAELQEAINDGVDNITLTDDIELTGSLVFSAPASQNPIARAAAEIPDFVLDLNGKNISGVDNSTGSYGLININPAVSLTIRGEGKISLTATNNRGWNGYSSVVSNQRGYLTVCEGVEIEHLGGTDMAYGIDNLTNTGAQKAITIIDGATVKSTYRAIRQFLNSTADGVNNELYVKRGTIEGTNKSIWMQEANANANPGKLIVESAAELKGNVLLSPSAGATEWPVEVSIAATSLKNESEVLVNDNVPVGYSLVCENGIWTVKQPAVGCIVELAGQKAVIFSVNDKEIKAVSVAEQNLNGKTWQDAMDWAIGLGEGWYLASMEDLNGIYDLRCELNDVLEADNAENALFWEGDELYIKNGSVYYALYISSTEVPKEGSDANGNGYFPNRVFFKIFNDLGYSDVLYSAFDCINKNAPLRDNYFARGVYIIKR